LPPTGAKKKFLTNPQKHVIGRKAFTGAKIKVLKGQKKFVKSLDKVIQISYIIKVRGQ